MPYLMCTDSVRKAASIPQELLCTPDEVSPLLGNWYCNRVVVGKFPIYLFMSDRTLLSFFQLEEGAVSASQLLILFTLGLEQTLELIGVAPEEIETLVSPYQSTSFAKPQSRSDVGSLHNLAQVLQHHARLEGGLHLFDIEETVVQMNQMPQRRLKWKTASEAARLVIAGAA